jgi:hypothetical protein
MGRISGKVCRSFGLGLVSLLGVSLLGTGAAAIDPDVKCESGKLATAAKYSACLLKADSKAAKKGIAPDYSKCDGKFSSAWEKRETKAAGACPTNCDEAIVQTQIATQAGVISAALAGAGLYAPDGMGGYYLPVVGTEKINALRACENAIGAGNCCNDACGSCNNRGFHECGAPNCNGSVYWNYDNNDQDMNCMWADPAEILISVDGREWTQ